MPSKPETTEADLKNASLRTKNSYRIVNDGKASETVSTCDKDTTDGSTGGNPGGV